MGSGKPLCSCVLDSDTLTRSSCWSLCDWVPTHSHTLRLVVPSLPPSSHHPLSPRPPQPPRAITHTLALGATSLKGYGACGAGYRHGNQTLWVLSLCTSWHSPDCKLAINCFSCCLICLQFLSTSVFNGVSMISQCQLKRIRDRGVSPSRFQRVGAVKNSRKRTTMASKIDKVILWQNLCLWVSVFIFRYLHIVLFKSMGFG